MVVEYGAGRNRILEISEDGKPVWEHRPPSLCVQCQPLANGHVVYAYGGAPTGVQEVDREQRVVWNYVGRCEQIMTCERLPGGNTLAAEQGPCRVVEVDPRGKIASTINIPVKAAAAHQQMRCVHALKNGHVLVANEADGVVREVDADGRVAWECPAGKFVYEALRLKNGNTLIGCGVDKRVIEVTPEKNIVWELTAQDVPDLNLTWITSLQVLKNGNYVVCNFLREQEGKGAHAFEITRDKKVVWKFADHGLVGMATTAWVLDELSPAAKVDVPPSARSDEGQIHSPVPRQVVQREGASGIVPIFAAFPDLAEAQFEYRVVPLKKAFGTGSTWEILEGKQIEGKFTAAARVAAGGWYRLELRGSNGKRVVDASVEPIGVGEVFLIAGQSYAANFNEKPMRINDPDGRVVAWDVEKKSWAVAHDPQPIHGYGGTSGSIWPAMGNLLLPEARVPIGFINVSSGATATRQWLPGQQLYTHLAEAGNNAGRFRAVLWQQGESDVIAQTTTETYVENLTTIRKGLAREWGFEPPWLLAKSTHHPTVYKDPEHERQIRGAIDELCRLPGFRAGPDTDTLQGENREMSGLRHFSAAGQERAGKLWFKAISKELSLAEAKR
jgi:hypothetical protein